MSSRSGWSSACRSGHHKACSGYRKTGKKRKKCACPCHGEAKAIEKQLREQGLLSPDTKVVVKRDPPAVISNELAANSGGPHTNIRAVIDPDANPYAGLKVPGSVPYLQPAIDRTKIELAAKLQPITREGFPQIMPKEELAADRPACFGNCAEISSTCDACHEYNACRRATP